MLPRSASHAGVGCTQAFPEDGGRWLHLGQALELMERRRSQISVLPVVDGEGRALGLLRIHDIYLGTR